MPKYSKKGLSCKLCGYFGFEITVDKTVESGEEVPSIHCHKAFVNHGSNTLVVQSNLIVFND
jgi:hypothetical protein